MVAVVNAAVAAGCANAKGVSAGTILRWRTASHQHLRHRVNVRHHIVQHHRGHDVTSVERLDVTQTFVVETHEMSTFLHRFSQVNFRHTSWSRKRISQSASGRTGSFCSSAPELSLGCRWGSDPLTPRGKSKSNRPGSRLTTKSPRR